MANKIVKITYDENTWIDMTGDTAVPANVLTNKTFHTSTGRETGSMPNGSARTPSTTIEAIPVITVDYSTGSISVDVNADESITPTVSAGYISSGTAGTVSVSGNYEGQLFTIYDGSHHSGT